MSAAASKQRLDHLIGRIADGDWSDPGVTPEDLALFQQRTGLSLPSEVVDYLQVFDGIEPEVPYYRGEQFIGRAHPDLDMQDDLELTIAPLREWGASELGDLHQLFVENMSAVSESRVIAQGDVNRAAFLAEGFLMIGYSNTGSLYLDLSRPGTPSFGQVVNYTDTYEEVVLDVIAENFTALIAGVIASLEARLKAEGEDLQDIP